MEAQWMISALPLTMLLAICSLAGCAGAPERPNTNLYQINVAGSQAEARGYNMHDDYDSDGALKSSAKPKTVELESLKSLRGWYCTDQQGLKNLKVYLGELRSYAKEHCK